VYSFIVKVGEGRGGGGRMAWWEWDAIWLASQFKFAGTVLSDELCNVGVRCAGCCSRNQSKCL